MEIREAVPADAAAIQTVARKTWHEAYDEILDPDAVEEKIDEWYDRDRLRTSIRNDDSPFFVAVTDDIVGLAQGGRSESGPADASVYRIYVDPDHWGEGIGSKLLGEVLDQLRDDGYDSVWLAVIATNEVGRSFYEKQGFREENVRMTTLAGHEIGEVILRKEISAEPAD